MSGLQKPKSNQGSAVADARGHVSQSPSAGTSVAAHVHVPGPVSGAHGDFPGLVDPSAFIHGVLPGRIDSLYPPGGFVNYLQQHPHPFMNSPSGSQMSENSNVVGALSSHTISPQGNLSVNGSNGHARAWLDNSIDSLDGNEKKSDQYWEDVTKSFNGATEKNRRRNRNQLKIRWDRIKKPLTEFHGCWTRITKIYQSGKSDDQLMDQALQLYASEHGQKSFVLSADTQKQQKGKENIANQNPPCVVNISERPMGHKRAKEERNGKRKASDGIFEISEKLEKFVEARANGAMERETMAALQESLANKKVEAAKLAHNAALKTTKCRMLVTYKEMMFSPTSGLSEKVLAERDKALKSMRLSLFSKDD